MFAQLTLRRSQNLDKVEVLKADAGLKQIAVALPAASGALTQPLQRQVFP